MRASKWISEGLLEVDDPVDIIEQSFLLNEVVAEAGRLKILTSAPEADSAACVERAVGRIKFNPIGVQLGVPELN